MTVHVLNADSNKTFYMSVEPTHGVYQPTGSPAPDRSWGDLLSIANLSLTGGSNITLSSHYADSP